MHLNWSRSYHLAGKNMQSEEKYHAKSMSEYIKLDYIHELQIQLIDRYAHFLSKRNNK